MLTFNLKKEWFEKIKSGEKTHEYREVKPYWEKRIGNAFGFLIDMRRTIIGPLINRLLPVPMMPMVICFKLGYPSPKEKSRIIYAEFKDIKVVPGIKTDLHIDKEVIDIEFEKIENLEEYRKTHLIVDDVPELIEKIKKEKSTDYLEIYKKYFEKYEKERVKHV